VMDGHSHGRGLGHGHGDGRSLSWSRLKRSETELERYETKWNARSRDGHGMVTGRSRFRLKTKELL
jgi:hypothetical protein